MESYSPQALSPNFDGMAAAVVGMLGTTRVGIVALVLHCMIGLSVIEYASVQLETTW